MRPRFVSLAASLLLAGCAGPTQESTAGADAVISESIGRSAPLERTLWQLIRVDHDGTELITRPNIDITLVIQPSGRFLLRGCNNVFGDIVLGTHSAMLDGGTGTRRVCPGTAGAVDAALRQALHGEVAWTRRGRSLELRNMDNGIRLDLRVTDAAQPPTSAIRVVSLIRGSVSCRIVVGMTEDGPRLYALSRTRPGGPWRLIPGGPATVGEDPLLAPQLLDRSTGERCTAGFAPPGTERVAVGPTAAGTQPLELHQVPGITEPVYVGLVPAGTVGQDRTLRAYGAADRVLALWPPLP